MQFIFKSTIKKLFTLGEAIANSLFAYGKQTVYHTQTNCLPYVNR